MERLGLGYARLAQANPRLVYCTLSGYGPDGPYRERAGHDLNYSGLAGLLDLTGPRDGPPVILGAPVADLAGALWATVGILLALLEREQTGAGQRVDASLLGGALACLPLALARLQGGQPMRRGAGDLAGGQVCYQIYATQDGGYMTLAALEPQFWSAFCQAVGREDLLNQQHAPTGPGEPVYENLCALFRSRTRSEWTAILSKVDACCEPVYTLAEALDSPPVQALGKLADAVLLPPVRLTGHPVSSHAPAPTLGQHTATCLAELGYDEAMVMALREQGVV
jgi:crotonobetainyl-CoA:carnitine CoA-transferase CaiB-like acyl-CoA transferase